MLMRVRALRLGLVDVRLRLKKRKLCRKFGLIVLRLVGEEHANDAFGSFRCRAHSRNIHGELLQAWQVAGSQPCAQ